MFAQLIKSKEKRQEKMELKAGFQFFSFPEFLIAINIQYVTCFVVCL